MAVVAVVAGMAVDTVAAAAVSPLLWLNLLSCYRMHVLDLSLPWLLTNCILICRRRLCKRMGLKGDEKPEQQRQLRLVDCREMLATHRPNWICRAFPLNSRGMAGLCRVGLADKEVSSRGFEFRLGEFRLPL